MRLNDDLKVTHLYVCIVIYHFALCKIFLGNLVSLLGKEFQIQVTARTQLNERFLATTKPVTLTWHSI